MTADSPVFDRWLSVDEVAEYLGVSRDTVYNWVSERGMPGRKVGRFWKFKKDAVDAWVESGGSDSAGGSSASRMRIDEEEAGA